MHHLITSQSLTRHIAGAPAALRAVCWRLRSGNNQATCALYSVSGEWQLRLEINGELHRAESFADQPRWVAAAVAWRTALGGEGWR